ncbi:MAG: DUF262 domain-containing protein [Chloroflexota bacterium]|nr:DUF262 domain-containing protein [Chloroflexota bacterium]MDE2895560.1 DUF262 domain-containing protein [Chloroflexota bacterium]
MQRETTHWSVQQLRSMVDRINFPEYQREPNLWSRNEKQRLIDSMMRAFDIASIYLYTHDDDQIDCVDGRQRIGAIMSFLGVNAQDEDNGFPFRALNEIEAESQADAQLAVYDGQTFAQLHASSDPGAQQLVKQFLEYMITIVNLSESKEAHEFNLQFTRLNLGTIINSGEKLNAMVGDLRDVCFAEDGLGSHEFLRALGVPTRRYAPEQLAAQILAQIQSLEAREEYTRTRHYDLQRLFKQGTTMNERQRSIVASVEQLLDVLVSGFPDPGILKNRAIAVSTVLLAWDLRIDSVSAAQSFAEFVEDLVSRLKWQIGKGLDVDSEYRYLVDFQRHITQASVEKPAVEARAVVMRDQYELWIRSGVLRGDEEWQARNPGKTIGVD